MVALPLNKWFRRSARQGKKTKPVLARRRRSLSLELLEGRIVPANTIDFGGLRFINPAGFTKNAAGDDEATAGIVSIGYTPASTEAFQPLLLADVDQGNLSDLFTLSTATKPDQPQFTLTDGHLVLQVGINSPGVPIPILDPNGSFVVDITQLKGDSGVSIPVGVNTHPIQVAKASFTLAALYFSNPNPLDTTDAQVKFQGGLTFDSDPILKDLGVEIDVKDINYVTADHTGITISGASISKSFTLDGVNIEGTIGIGYVKETDTFSMSGTVAVSTTPDPTKTATINGVEAGIYSTIVHGQMQTFGFTVSGSFTIKKLTVSVVGNNSQPFSFQYDVVQKQFELGGGLQLAFNGNTFTADFGQENAPGIVIKNGELISLNAAIIIKTAGKDKLNGLSLVTTDDNGLQVLYDKAKDVWQLSGGLQLTIPTGNSVQLIGADLVDQDGNPGLIIKDGVIQKLSINVLGSFSIFGLKVAAQPAAIDWDPATKTYTVGGTFIADFDVFKSTLTLGDAKNPGLKIVNGHFSVGDVKWTINNIILGPVTVNALTIAYAPDGSSFDLNVDLNVTVVNKITVDADFGVVNGKFDSFLIDVEPTPGTLVIPDTGLSIVKLEAKVSNISNPSAIVVVGSMAVVWGDQIPMLGHPVYLFRAEGDVTADANELIIEATAQLGAYSDDNGATWQGALGSGDAKLTLDWADNFYSLHVAVDGLLGIFDVTGDLVFESGKEIALLATATVVIPTEIPFIGGDTIGGVGFFFQHVFAHDNVPTSTTFAAWLDITIFTTFTVGFELVIDGNGHLSDAQLIGGSQVAQFEADVQPPVKQTYVYIYQPTFGTAPGQVPPAATSLILSADWSQSASGIAFSGRPTFIVEKIIPGQQPVYIQEQDFGANGISIISDSKFNGPSKGAVQIVGSPTDPFAPLAAQYALQVVITTDGGNPFPDYPNKTTTDYLNIQNTYTVPTPTFGPVSASGRGEAPLLPSTNPTGAFPVTLQGNVDEGLLSQAKVTLYRINLADPFQRGVLIGSSALTATNIVPNPGFESPQAPFTVPPAAGPLYWYNPTGASWTFTGSSGIAANGSPFNNPNAPAGTQVAFLQDNGSFNQTINFAAGTFNLSFQATQRSGQNQTFQVLVDGIVVGTFQPTGAGFQAYSTNAFSVTAGSHTVEFLGTDTNGGDKTVFIDSVSVVAASINVPGSGFDAPEVQNDPGAFRYNPTGSPWTFTGTSGIAANGSAFNNPNAPEGSQVAILQNNGSFSQAVTFSTGAYTINFQAVQRPGAKQTFQVLVDGNVVGTFQPTGASFQSYTTHSFRVTAGSHNVEFLGTDTNGGDNTVFIDSVSYTGEETNWEATFNVPINGLNPGQYVLYAVINDGFNSPVASPNSVPFTPGFAVQGQITNQSNDAEGGWSVYLDYNNNGVQDPDEPGTTTNSTGYYSFVRSFGDPVLAPVSLTGFSQDVVFETGTASPTVSHDFDDSGFAWFQTGATDTNHVTHYNGLPSYFTSQFGTTFQFQNFSGNNVLLLGGGMPSSGTLTLTTPATYTTLSILASASNPATPTGMVTIHYSDGTTGVFTYNAPDWGSGAPSSALPSSVARAKLGAGATFLGTDPNSGPQWNMFEVEIEPDPTRQVASLEFVAAGPNTTGIFAISGGVGTEPVPINASFKVAATPLAPGNFDPVPAIPVTFNGTSTVTQPIAVKEHSAIKGTVFVDQKNDGQAAHGQGVAGATVYIDVNGSGTLDDGDLTAITDASGHYSFANLSAGTYKVLLDATSLSDTTPTAAYVVPAGTVGNQANAFTYGESFSVNKPIELTSLGAFDSAGDGFTQMITVVLYDQATKAILAQVTFTPADPGVLVGGSRFKMLAHPITLLPGFKGIIAAYGFSAADPAGDAGTNAPTWTTYNDVGRLTFNNGVFANTAGAFPATTNASNFANPYAAGTLLFREPAWTQTADTPTSYTITIDNSGYSLQENADFGTLPPSYITGTITGNPLLNGQVAPDTVPLAGWTVNLLGDVPAAQIDAGGSGVAAYGADADFTGGAPATTSTDIDTSQVFNPAPVGVYRSGRAATDGAFTYRFTGLTPGVAYAVRLHFAEIVYVAPGQRLFNVTVNGTQVLSSFDIFATAGAANTAIVKAFDTVADPIGTITIVFTDVSSSAGPAFVNGLEILQPNQVIATTTSDAEGNYLFNQPTPGQYTIRQAPPANWRQVSPFFSNPSFTSDGFDGPDSTAFITGAVMVTGDFSGKGYADVAVVRQDLGQRSISVFYNSTSQPGSAPFFGITNRQLATAVIVAAVACDLNNDGRLDIAVLLQDNTVGAFLNTGSGEGNELFQFVANYWTLPASVSGYFMTGFTAADLNHDGLDDLLLGAFNSSEFSGTVMVLLNSTNPAARTVTRYDLPVGNLPDAGINVKAGPLAVADFNGDGKLDVMENGGPTSVNEGDFTIAFGDGKGGLSPWTTYELPIPLRSNNGGPMSLGDIKGDGTQSAVLGNFGTAFVSVELAFNRGNGVFDVVHLFDSTYDAFKFVPAGYQFLDVQLKDVNGDLKPDLVFLITPPAGSGVPEILVYLNTGSYPYYQVSDPFLFQLPSGAGAALNFAISDVNNDGLNDILVGTQPTAGNGGYLLLNTSPRKQPGIPVFLNAGVVTGGNDFLNVQTPAGSAVFGQVFDDRNRNAIQDTAETGSAGSFVFVDLNRNHSYDIGEPFAATRSNGVFSIPNLPAGVYSVGVFPDDDSRTTTPEFMDVTVDADTAGEANFGLATRLIRGISDQQVNVNQTVSLTVPVTANTAGHKLVFTLDSNAPEGATIDPTTGFFTWTPTASYAGLSAVATVRVRDLNNPTFTETQSFTIEVAGSAAVVSYVNNLYVTLLGRSAAEADLAYWIELLSDGTARQLVTQQIWESAEHRGLEVDQVYDAYLKRTADAAGRIFWTNALRGGMSEETLAQIFLSSTEYQQAHAGSDAYVTGVYADVLGREPDEAGLNFWRAAAQRGVSAAQIAEYFLGSLEADERRVDGYYQTYLGRAADATGAQMWLDELQSGQLTPAQVAQAFLASDEFFARVAGS